ncbi:acyclic terpene utilization AtuA family protein [Nonomuraea sp. NPDC050404]|uniref:acyclic terpene utilization AtuA family protein n=1 Tax=Nonomuraea sp. NPDC050404 TaxID=3155783 RepID=UPI003407C24D
MVLRVANCSGFYGDRLSAAREMVTGGPIDVLTGDWLAELTMLILAGNRLKGRPGYATTFLRQLEDVLGTCLDRGIKIVTNAGGLDPAGCAQAVHDLATRLGLSPTIAHVTGDNLITHPTFSPTTGTDSTLSDLSPETGDNPTTRPFGLRNADTGELLDLLDTTPLTANAYLGGRPIAAALSAGADVVVTGRVTDAALVTGPGIWRYGWGPDDLDPLAGSVVAGHIIECGCQATGGNYAFFQDVPDLAHCGFPLAELRADGSCVITKHPGTGGLVSIGTVTAQLVYELDSPRYLGPDVVARFDTIHLSDDGPDRVLVSGVRGEPPPDTLKVAVNYLAGYRNTMTLVLTGLDVAAKARIAEEAIWARIPKDSFNKVDVTLTDTGLLRITVMSPDERTAGRAFSSAVVETGLASYPGFYALSPPGNASPYGVYWPVLIPATDVHPQIFLNGNPLPPHQPKPPPPTTHLHEPHVGQPAATHATRPDATHTDQPDPTRASQPNATHASRPDDTRTDQPEAAREGRSPAEPGPLPAPRRRDEVRRGPALMNGAQPASDVSETGEHPLQADEHPAPPPDALPPHLSALPPIPLGRIAGARSGDKGGNANLGIWTDNQARYDWLAAHLTPDTLKRLLPALADHRVDRHDLPNLRALNFVIHGLLGRGVAASPRMDPQAKALGEELRAQLMDIPEALRPDPKAVRP